MDYVKKHKELLSVLRSLGGDSPDMLMQFDKLHEVTNQPGEVPTKYKELIALGISISIRCEECISYHMNDVIKAGATDQEILETINVSVLMGGGPALMYATHAYEAMKEFRKESQSNS